MKRLFQTITLLGALVLTPQALAQEKPKNYPYIPIFNREKFVQQISYQNRGEYDLHYSPRINSDPNELEVFINGLPMLGTVYRISKDNEPLQLFPGITFDLHGGNGLARRLVTFFKK